MPDKIYERLNKKIREVWSPHLVFTLSYQNARALGFIPSDAALLERVGLPQFAAPHIWFDCRKSSQEGYVRMGECLDGLVILYNTSDGHIFCNENNQQIFMGNGILELLDCLMTMANLIDNSIDEMGPDVYKTGPFPVRFIIDALSDIRKVLGDDLAPSSFWCVEIEHLAARQPV